MVLPSASPWQTVGQKLLCAGVAAMTLWPSPASTSTPQGCTWTFTTARQPRGIEHLRSGPPLRRADVLVDDFVHMDDILLLSGIQVKSRTPSRLHTRLYMGHVGVVLVGHQAPVLRRPIRIEFAFAHLPLITGRHPFERPEILDRAVGVETVRANPEQRGAPGVDGTDDVREEVDVVGAQ